MIARELWAMDGDDETGFYIEGQSPESDGWFCMELETRAEMEQQLIALGFSLSDLQRGSKP
jgi:hypothetical protein